MPERDGDESRVVRRAGNLESPLRFGERTRTVTPQEGDVRNIRVAQRSQALTIERIGVSERFRVEAFRVVEEADVILESTGIIRNHGA
jgi:hypothetical protein